MEADEAGDVVLEFNAEPAEVRKKLIELRTHIENLIWYIEETEEAE